MVNKLKLNEKFNLIVKTRAAANVSDIQLIYIPIWKYKIIYPFYNNIARLYI